MKFEHDHAMRMDSVFDSSKLGEELRELRGEVSRLLNMPGDGILDAPSDRTVALADQVKAALNDLGKDLERAGRLCRELDTGSSGQPGLIRRQRSKD
jgi:hypothetical protein